MNISLGVAKKRRQADALQGSACRQACVQDRMGGRIQHAPAFQARRLHLKPVDGPAAGALRHSTLIRRRLLVAVR